MTTGTYAWMAPEVFKSQKFSKASDVWRWFIITIIFIVFSYYFLLLFIFLLFFIIIFIIFSDYWFYFFNHSIYLFSFFN